MEPSDADLVRQCLEGDNSGFDLIVKRYQKQVLGLCYRILGDADQAADAAQESFVKAYRTLNRFRQDASFLSWLYRIASNTCIDLTRSRKRRQADPLGQAVAGARNSPPEEAVVKAQTSRLVHRAVLSLPMRYRLPLVMFYFGEMKIREISASLGRPEGTVKSDLHIARRMLRRKLKGVVVEI